MLTTEKEVEQKMLKSLDVLVEGLKMIKTGRANPDIVSEIKVEVYNSSMPIKQLATISIPDPKVIIIQPWDKSIVSAVSKAIEASSTGLTPVVDTELIRINIPSLTEETRKEYVKVVKTRIEETRITLRQIRHEAVQQYEHSKEAKEITEDEFKNWRDSMDKLIADMNKKVEEIGSKKEHEILSIN